MNFWVLSFHSSFFLYSQIFKSHDHILLLEQSVLTNRGVHGNRKNSWHQRRSEHSFTRVEEYLLHGGYGYSCGCSICGGSYSLSYTDRIWGVPPLKVANLGFKLTRVSAFLFLESYSLGNIRIMEKIGFYQTHSYKQITVFPGIFQKENKKDLFLIFSHRF